MSREVRRVPVGWQHPVEHNPHWAFQSSTPYGRSKPASRRHAPAEQFVSLLDDYPGAMQRWESELADMKARRGRDWEWNVKYYLTGYQGQADAEPVAHPWYVDETPTVVRDEDHLHELSVAEIEQRKPDPADYMPVFDQPKGELGWCLYQTVSEGTPVTPVFATADELIDHLATVGQDWDQQPMRREAAETLVRSGHSLGSFVAINGELLDGAKDADRIEAQLSAS